MEIMQTNSSVPFSSLLDHANPPSFTLSGNDMCPVSFLHHRLTSVSVSVCLYLSASSQTSQSVSQMSQCLSCHGSAHKCLFVSLSSLQTQVLHRPVNGFVRWPFHRASHEDRQGTAISPCVRLRICVCTCICFSHRQQRLGSGNKRLPKYPP